MNRSILLDLLRVVAIVLVFVAHFGQVLGSGFGDFFGLKNFYYVSLGGVGVSLFLVLSGILAGLGAKPSGYFEYLVKKILRIYPLYWLSVPVAMVGYLLNGLLVKGSLPELFPHGVMTDLLASITGLYAWVGLWGGPYNSPSWFIALIMSMYVLFPLLFYTLKRWPHFSLATIFVVSIGARYYIGQQGLPFMPSNLWDDVEGWFYRQYGFMPGRPGDWFPLCRVFEFSLGIYLSLRVPKAVWFKWTSWFRWPIQYLSDLSFPLFLIHYPFLFMIAELQDANIPPIISIPIYMLCMVAIAHGINRVDQKLPRKKIMGYLSKS